MRITFAILSSLLLLANANVSTANIIFTPVVTSQPPAGPGFTQQITVRLAMTGVGGNAASNSVNSFGFSAALAPASASLLATNISWTEVGFGTFGTEFSSHTPLGTGSSGNPVIFSGTITSPAGFQNFSDIPDPVFTHRYREISFTVNRLFSAVPLQFVFSSAAGGFVGPTGSTPIVNFTTANAVNAAGQSFSISAVPEPTSIALVALVGGIAACARLRTRKANKKSVSSAV